MSAVSSCYVSNERGYVFNSTSGFRGGNRSVEINFYEVGTCSRHSSVVPVVLVPRCLVLGYFTP